jgi:Dyp-type peroxidase family
MPTNVPVREAPFPFSLANAAPTDDAAEHEPLLDVGDIQGNILAGFNKDNQTLMFLEIKEPIQFKKWLVSVIPFIATTDEVLQFNRLFKSIRTRRGVETRTILATWLNIAFSFRGLKKLDKETEEFKDEAFRKGLAKRSALLSDPPKGEGFQKNWLVGGEDNEADLVLIVASDTPDEMGTAVRRLEGWIYEGTHVADKVISSGLSVIFKQKGATLPDPFRGHEHFGFLDGVSQPGIRGIVGTRGELLTPKQNPADPNQGKPGQDRLWPGEFVFGYPAQDSKDADKRGKIRTEGPSWTRNGSFLVFRRLRQDVGAFHEFLDREGDRLNLGSEQFGAKCVGRWASGTPIERAQMTDNLKMSRDDCANNAFDFQKNTIPRMPTIAGQCKDNFPQDLAGKDTVGAVCPFAGHIRKAYPRDDISSNPKKNSGPNEADTETHRLLRRGIPFGEPFDATIIPDDGNRGLLFLGYQTSIVEQFEFVISHWVNNPDFKDPGSGHDPILGQSNSRNGSRERSFTLKLGSGEEQTIRLEKDFVIPTGGGYFFAPSISAMQKLSNTASNSKSKRL